jgi:xanthine dehydrogenase accessory factor
MNDEARAMELNETANTHGGLRGLLETLWRIHTRDQAAVLGIVIATDGSTYQKPGALVLLDATGLRHGVISGGCLEPALEHAAHDVHVRGRAALVEFDTRSDDDMLFGSGIGCRGRVQLLLLPLPPQAPLARALFGALDLGVALTLSLAIDAANAGAGFATFATKSTMQHSALRWDNSGGASDVEVDAALSVQVPPAPRLLLLGAGPETPPLAAFARRLGWFVSVVEHRGRWAAFAHAARVDRVFDWPPTLAAARLDDEAAEAIIVMSHNYAMDLQHLAYCARSKASYVGLLGPVARRDALLGELNANDRALIAPRLHAPVGLDLGGHGAEAIALAIAAELQRHFAARSRSHAPPPAVLAEHA